MIHVSDVVNVNINRFVVIVAACGGILSAASGCSTSTAPSSAAPAPAGASAPAGPASASESTTSPAADPAPASTEPASTEPASTKPASTASATKKPATATGGCPKASTLQAAAKLDKGFAIDASTIDCWQDWVVAGVKAPTVAQQGDGLLLFQRAATGSWRKVNEGSSFDCATDLGLTAGTDHPAWCTFG